MTSSGSSSTKISAFMIIVFIRLLIVIVCVIVSLIYCCVILKGMIFDVIVGVIVINLMMSN